MFILLSSFKITLKLELKKGIYLFNCLKKKKNLVVGAGFSGAVIAERLANIMDEDVLVIDKNSFLGGESFDYKDKSGIMVQNLLDDISAQITFTAFLHNIIPVTLGNIAGAIIFVAAPLIAGHFKGCEK